MARGNRKFSVFEDDDDRVGFLRIVDRATVRYGVTCYAFCLMNNHYHFVFATPRENLSQTMQYVNGLYARRSNRRHARTGHLFEGRFKSIVVETETYLRDLARYIALNPVRAGLAKDPSSWAWSSYRATAGLEPPLSFLDVGWINWAFGGANQKEAQLKYQLFVNDALSEISDIAAAPLTLGTPPFDRALRNIVQADRIDRRLPRAHRALGRPTLGEVFGATDQSQVDRNERIREAHIRYGYTLAEVGRFLGLHPRTPSVILRRLDAATGQAFD